VGKAEDSHLSGCGFKPGRRIVDGVSKASYYIGKRNKAISFKFFFKFFFTGLVSENFSRGPINDVSFTAKPNELQICGKSFKMKQFLNRCLVGVVYLKNEK
jgi:hypothetical protein